MNVFNYYKSFINQINGTQNTDKDVGQFLILSDSATKKDLCNKIFKLLINETYVYYNRLTADRKEKFMNFIRDNYEDYDFGYPDEGVYNKDPYSSGRLYVDSSDTTDANGKLFCLISEYDWLVELDDDYNIILHPNADVSTHTYYDVGLEIVSEFVDNIENHENDCLDCCDRFFNLSKCFVMYKMIDELREEGKDKEVNFYLKYIACVLKAGDGYAEEENQTEYPYAYTQDESEQAKVIFPEVHDDPNPNPNPNPEPDPDPDPEPDPDPDEHKDEINLWVEMVGDDMCCIFNGGEHYSAALIEGEVILSNLYNKYSIYTDSNNNIILR